MYAIIRKRDGLRLAPIDNDGTNSFIVWPTLEEAEIGFKDQMEKWLDDGEDEWEIRSLDQLPPLLSECAEEDLTGRIDCA